MVTKTAASKQVQYMTPPIPKDLPGVELTGNARQVLVRRYVRRGDQGEPAETVEEMFWRVAYYIARAEQAYGGDVESRAREFYALLTSKKFFPNSPTFTGAGTPLGQLAACFTATMRVTTDQGVKPIAELQIGDRVLTHTGSYEPVTHLSQRAYDGELLRIKVKLIGTTLEVTPEHPVLTDHGWVKAGLLKVGDKLAIGYPKGVRPKPQFDLAETVYAGEMELQVNEEAVRVRKPSVPRNLGRQAEWTARFIDLTPDLARLCGYYVSEGSIDPEERYVRFAFGKDEVDYQKDVIHLVRDIFGVRCNQSDSNFGNWTTLNFYSRPFTAWLHSNFGLGAGKKRIPIWLQFADPDTQKAFLIGIMRGDGLFFEKTYVVPSRPHPRIFRTLRLTLSNPGLIQQIWQLALRLGYDAAIRTVDTTYVTPNANETGQISLPPLQSRDLVKKAFNIDLPEPDHHYIHSTVSRQEDQVFFEIEKISGQPYEGTVYNCEVGSEHTYVTEGVVVHNCFVLPIADDMGRNSDGIFQTLRDAALIQQTGGGNGFSFARLRPKGTLVKSSAGQATGPVGFLRVYDHAFGEVAQGGCLLPETLVFTEDGLLRLDELADVDKPGWQEKTRRVATDEGWCVSPRAYNNGIAPVLRVHTRQGLSLAGTPEHKVKVMSDEGPVWRTLSDLQPGDWLLVQMGQQRGKLRALRHPVPSHFNQMWPHLPPVLDEELAFFIGYLIGDGFVASGDDDHRVGVSISHASYLMKDMPVLMERLFGVTIHRQQKADDRSVTLVMDNRAVKEFLQLNGLSKIRSLSAQVPRLIRQSPANIVGAFLRGLFEADGGVWHGYPGLSTTSLHLVEEVSTLLVGLGCPVRVRTIIPGPSHYGKNAVYQLRITSSVSLQAWRDRVGCDPRSRFAACMAWESDLQRESSYVLPNARYWLEPVLEAITFEQIDPRGRGINFRSESPRLRRALLRYLRGDRHLTRSGYDELRLVYPEFAAHAISPEGKWFVQVLDVQPEGQALTLDLEVEANHTYLANGLVTHNTRRGANMAVLRVDHPDIEEFITCKTDENQITNFNISVGVTDAFMKAVREDASWDLRFPDVTSPKYRGFNGTLEQAEAAGIPIRTYRTVRARDLFEKIVQQAHHNGEPGMLFLDAANRGNPVPHLYQLESTNPCLIGSTRIATDQGVVPIEDLAETASPFLVANDERAPEAGEGLAGNNCGVVYRPSSIAWKTRQNVPVIRLITKHGFSITATPDHKILTSDRGYVELAQLKPGDELLLQSGEGIWNREHRLPNVRAIQEKMMTMAQVGDRVHGHLAPGHDFLERYAHLPQDWSHELGVVLGCLVGDGWLSPSSNSPVGMVFNKKSDELLEIVHGTLREYFGEGHLHERTSVRQLTYGRLPFAFFESLGVVAAPAYQKRVPNAIWQAPREAVIGFLQGLFTTDGTVNHSINKKSCSVRLASSSPDLLTDVQLLLLNFGIVSRIHRRREEGYRPFPDGKGGGRDYFAHADYELIIDKTNRDKFASEIGFLNKWKQAKVDDFISRKVRLSNGETFRTKIVSIEDAGTADVYDLTEPRTHSLIANGLVAHNCGEQFLGSYESCCLGSINLNEHCLPDGKVDWESLCRSVELATRFLDNVVDMNAYVPAVPQLKEAAHRARRIGLGIMGLADMMYHVGVRYGSPEGQEFGAQVMEFVRYHAVATSIRLAKERGAFPAIKGSVYDAENLCWTPPQGLRPYTDDWGRPLLDWSEIMEDLSKHGIRNAAQTTVAPTGTIATVAGCEGYGCEPVFALAYIRHVNDNGKDLQLTYASPRFDETLERAGITGEARQEIVERVMRHGSCQDIPEVPESVRKVFVVAGDITAEEHVRMQAALQAFVDNSLSKTVNFPESATTDDIARTYLLAWELDCKGITVYVTGSREKVVLETKATAEKKKPAPAAPIVQSWTPPTEGASQDVSKAEIATQLAAWHESKKPRPRALVGRTFRVETPLGKAFITVNENGGGHPFEVFINTAKAGSETAAVSEAIGRLISYVLRLASPIVPRDRLAEVVRQLSGIGGGRSLGFGPNRVRSLPDGVGQVLDEYLEGKTSFEVAAEVEAPGNGHQGDEQSLDSPRQTALKMGDLCPECGEATMVNEEGCRKCYTCGYSEC